ncbi:hypothetical protein ACFFQF_08150 [Haladaptatus pallidirubidus]|uniref:Uncharacterized protein n=1 Tax=Haladaptatus pallidirubidus TaxID=1008152 RepID=A0AAV3UG58_9EURY|nr:hypothetical protein [Haladaptatus pallidirubidus]
MDRISALRNIEDALSSFESGENDLQTTEQRVLAVLRTYATEFESESGVSAYRARGDHRADGIVVVAESEESARTRVYELLGDRDTDFRIDII